MFGNLTAATRSSNKFAPFGEKNFKNSHRCDFVFCVAANFSFGYGELLKMQFTRTSVAFIMSSGQALLWGETR